MAGISEMNKFLDPVIFQVIGSTPESIRDNILKSTLKGQASGGLQLAVISVFASAVNKSTMETFAAKPELQEARGFINTIFSISGRANMTGLTLLGHCLMTTAHVSNVNFCSEFRKKMGQDHLWAGNLDSGSLSEKQKEILKEKKRTILEPSAKLLGSGYFKYVGIDPIAMSNDEANFWRVAVPTRLPASSSASAMPPPAAPLTPSRPGGSVRNPSISGSPPAGVRETVEMMDGTMEMVDSAVVEYYRKFVSDDDERLATSIAKRGVNKFEADYRAMMVRDPEGRSFQGGTVAG